MIEFTNVSFSYPGQEKGSLHDINLTIQKGECVLLCGRSGCGKTTLTRLVNGLIPHFYQGDLSGTVKVNGTAVADTSMYKSAETIGSVFQNPRTQFFNVDTDSEIAFGIENEALPPAELKKRVDETTKELHIEKLRQRNIFELSGGEKQKIAFASVYAMNPDIYLLDEPSSNLDMTAILELKEHLKLIKEQGKTILIAEHRLYYLMDLADRILYLANGRIERSFTAKEFKELTDEERHNMGLRAADLNVVHPKKMILNEKKEPVLELKNVTLSHKKRIILENIRMQASAGEVIAVVGHNGAGKTTFSRALCGLHKDAKGTFYYHGIAQDKKKRLRQSYMVMQDVNYQLFADSVKSEVVFGMKAPDMKLVQKTIDELGLAPFQERHPNTLSGGQKQRTAVAVSMICKKEILIFDEPTSGLDYDSMLQVAELIRKLSKLGKIIFVVTHDYEFVCQTCSRVLHFDEGEMPDDLLVTSANEGRLKELFSIQDNSISYRGESLGREVKRGEREKRKSSRTAAYLGGEG